MTRKLGFIILILGIAGVGLANAWMYWVPVATAPIADQVLNVLPASEDTMPEDATRSPPDSGIGHALARPLFTSTRRPWITQVVSSASVMEPVLPAAVAIAPPPSPPPSLLILGIQKIPSGSKALLAHTGQSDAQWHKVGDIIDEWAIAEISTSSVRMEHGPEKLKLELYPVAVTKLGEVANSPSLDSGITPIATENSALPAAQAGAQ